MNNKHLACVVVGLLVVLMTQGVLQVRKGTREMQRAAENAKAAAAAVSVTLDVEKSVLAQLRRRSDGLIRYLDAWEPYITQLNSPEAGEINLTASIKEAGLVGLAQRFDVVTTSELSSIPRAVRARLTFEDDFAKTINWLGEVEAKLPIARVSNLKIARGQTGNDVKMDVVIDIPLVKPGATPAPVP